MRNSNLPAADYTVSANFQTLLPDFDYSDLLPDGRSPLYSDLTDRLKRDRPYSLDITATELPPKASPEMPVLLSASSQNDSYSNLHESTNTKALLAPRLRSEPTLIASPSTLVSRPITSSNPLDEAEYIPPRHPSTPTSPHSNDDDPEPNSPPPSSGQVRTRITWKDKLGHINPVRSASVEIWSSADRTHPTELISRTITNEDGYINQEINRNLLGETEQIFLKVFATSDEQPILIVSPDEPSRPGVYESYSFSAFRPVQVTVTYDSHPGIVEDDLDRQSFSVNDAMHTASKVYENVFSKIFDPENNLNLKSRPRQTRLRQRNGALDPSVYIPNEDTLNTPDENTLNILGSNLYADSDAYNWDNILHEYGHFVSDQNNWLTTHLSDVNHNFGVSNIVSTYHLVGPEAYKYTKDNGVKLAWREGLANYLSLAIQEIAKENNWLPNVFNAGDLAFSVNGNRYNFEYADEHKAQGEGDELTVARILWDLADDNPDMYSSGLQDRVSLGHKGLLTLFKDIAAGQADNGRRDRPADERLNQLNDIWKALSNSLDTRGQADVGAIFEEYNVSPSPKLAANSILTAEPYNFEWSRGNEADAYILIPGGIDEANDQFQVAILNQNFETIIASPSIREQNWQPSSEEWAKLQPHQTYYLIVSGTDNQQGLNSGVAYTESEVTGGYWSGARPFSIGEVNRINISNLKSGVTGLSALRSSIEHSERLVGLPIVGSLSEGKSLRFLGEIQSALTAELVNLDDLVTASELKRAFVSGLAKGGINALSDDINFVTEADGSTRFDFKLRNTTRWSQSLASDLGLPGLGLTLGSGGNLDLALDYGLNFSLGLSQSGTVSFSTPGDKDISLQLKATMPKGHLSGKLGFLQVDVTDDVSAPSQINLNVGIDADNLAGIDITGSTNLNLDLKTSFADSRTLPALLADLDLDWDFSGGKPTVAFNNVRLDAGSFFRSFASPLLNQVQSVTQPLQPVANLLTQGVSVGGRSVNMQSVFGLSSASGTFIDALSDVADVVALVNRIGTSANRGFEINLGSFDLGAADIRSNNFSLSQATPIATYAPEFLGQTGSATADQRAFFTLLGTSAGSGLAFPLLTDRNQAFNLLLGKDANLFTYDLPRLSLGAGFQSPFIPIFGPLGARIEGRVDATADINLGFDTHGLRKVAEGAAESHVFDGLYLTTDSGLDFDASLLASAELNLGIARAGAGGGVTGSLDLRVNDSGLDGSSTDGKVHLDGFSSLGDAFNKSGRITAGLHAYFKVGWGWLSYTKRFTGPSTTLINFGGTANRSSDEPSVVALVGASVAGNEIAYERTGSSSSDVLVGSSETDFFIGGDGADRFEGAGGFDVASYAIATAGVRVDLELGYGLQGDAEGDTYDSIEQVEGSEFDDMLWGGSSNDVFDGLGGNDSLCGRGGNDSFLGSKGGDLMDGGVGSDSLSYSVSEEGVNIDLAAQTASGGYATGDRIISIENLEGSVHNDQLLGDFNDNILSGLDGDDVLLGGAGFDKLTGGLGRDRFIIQGGGNDTITDFNPIDDKLWVDVEFFSDLTFTQQGSNTVISLAGSMQTIATLQGIRSTAISEENFANGFEQEPIYTKPFQSFPVLDKTLSLEL